MTTPVLVTGAAGFIGMHVSLPAADADGTPYAVYNIGNNRPNSVNEFIAVLERVLGRKAIRKELPIQPGDVPVTCASIERLQSATGFAPVTTLEQGLATFGDWFRGYRGK